MKTLLLLRHAKSGWKDVNLRDFDRPLASRGTKDAAAIGRWIGSHNLNIEIVISSPAERARATIEIVLKSAMINPEIRYDERIYEASTARLLEIVLQLDEPAKTVLMVGHNPGFSDLVNRLTGVEVEMSTAALARINLDIASWKDADQVIGDLKKVINPKQLADG